MAEQIRPDQIELAQRLEKELADRGLLIAGGWAGFRVLVIPKDAPQIQLDEMRNAFFAGAQHLFTAIMSVLEPGQEPTQKDLERFDKIDKELRTYLAEFERAYGMGGRMQ